MTKTKWILTSVLVVTLLSSVAYSQEATFFKQPNPNPTDNVIQLKVVIINPDLFRGCVFFNLLGKSTDEITTGEFLSGAKVEGSLYTYDYNFEGQQEGIYFVRCVYGKDTYQPTYRVIFSEKSE